MREAQGSREASGGARAGLLTGTPPKGAPDAGRPICACFGVGEKTLRAAIAGGCASVEAIGARLKAGTHCGSCVPEIKALLARDGGAKGESRIAFRR